MAPRSGRRSGTSPCRSCAACCSITLILQLIATAQLFTEPLLFTGGGPANATMTVLLLIYRYAFQNSLGGDYGMAAALSLMLAVFLAVFTAVLLLADPLAGARAREAALRAPRTSSSETARARDRLVRRLAPCRRFRWTLHAIQGGDPASFLLIVGLGPLLWMAKSVDHADPGHAALRRWRCSRTASTSGNLATAWSQHAHRPVPAEHGA